MASAQAHEPDIPVVHIIWGFKRMGWPDLSSASMQRKLTRWGPYRPPRELHNLRKSELPVRSPQSGDNGEADHKEISCSDVRTQGVQNTQTHTRTRARKHTLEQQKTGKCAFNTLKGSFRGTRRFYLETGQTDHVVPLPLQRKRHMDDSV